MTDRNIVLTGFMGSGKSRIGREVAERLGWPLADMDDMIVARAGKPIPAIFAEDGEAAFRAIETSICQELGSTTGHVIATGGGALLNPANRLALEAGGTVICLEARPEVLVRRLAGDRDRPLLAGALPSAASDGPEESLAERIGSLLARRAAAYASLPYHLDTSDLAPEAAAERVLGIAADLPGAGQRIVVAIREGDGRPYDVLVAEGLLAEAGARLIRAGLKPGRCAVITNPTLAAFHGETLRAALACAGFDPLICLAPDGEAHKTLTTAERLFGQLADAQLSRDEPIIALGGGVIGDTAGLVAATWLRGVPFVQIPTSLLAMVDASVGGKVAVDLPQGKNLVGAFKQPVVVLIDPALLATLPPAERRSGLAEVLKAGLIADPGLFEALAGEIWPSWTELVAAAVRMKARIVERDPFERGERAWLNLGHTFGHAFELLSQFTLRHGEAVSVGMVAAAELSARLGLCTADLRGRVAQALERLELPTHYACDPAAAIAAMGSDKKRRGRSLRFVALREIGEVVMVEDPPLDAVRAALDGVA